jgi:hypothetical protein
MSMELYKGIEAITGISTAYSMAQEMTSRGCKITTSGCQDYKDNDAPKRIRLDVISVWLEMAAEKGVPTETVVGWLKKDVKKSK